MYNFGLKKPTLWKLVQCFFIVIESFVQLGSSLCNSQKVQLNTNLLKHRTQYLYTKETGQLKLNEKSVELKVDRIKLGKFN